MVTLFLTHEVKNFQDGINRCDWCTEGKILIKQLLNCN